MVYLRKFHFVYAWFASSYREEDLGHAISQLYGTFDLLMTNKMERSLFKEACDQAWKMLNPVHFSFSVSEPNDYADSERFPFRAEKPIQGGNFGTLKKLEIVEEYYDHSIEARMKEYGRSVVGHGSERKLLFAIKSVKTSDRDNLALAEQEMLRMVSRMESSDAKNIVTLLTCYTWRNEMHFVFPYIETDLSRLLRQEAMNTTSPWFKDQALPENKLWKEMVGVACALSAIHTKIRNPFERVPGRVFACHFDLKPANILVTADGKLKIGDFGHSHIQVVAPEGQPKIQYRGGDPRYAAPESQWETDQTDEWLEPHEDGGAPALKYDVWSLACIMTEVLIYLLNRQTSGGTPTGSPLVRFNESLARSPQVDFNGRFFDQNGVKECVSTTIEAFQDRFSAECAAGQYMTKIIDLLFGMFQYKSHQRISSRNVANELKDAGDVYEESRDPDDLAFAVRQHRAPANKDFEEIGWVPAQSGGGNREPISFEKM
ncbi:hypothetical protein NW767_009733 [Fusarium falciforme]|nr:hypothetical protein NW767_009733 [Fusarium falciforme]